MSMAAVAMARGINANLLRRWVRDAETHGGGRDGTVVVSTPPKLAEFVAVKVQDSDASEHIRIELRRGSTTVTMSWPSTAAADCATWLRELLR
jgi:transposase-like protein